MQNVASLSSSRCHVRVDTMEPLQANSTIFCDFDGPIADVSDRYYSTYTLALNATHTFYADQGIELPINPLTKVQFWHMKQNRVPDATISAQSGLPAHTFDRFSSHVEQLVNQPALLHQDKLQPGAKAALTALQNRGVRVVIVTLRKASQVLDFLHAHDLATTISQIYGANDAATAYPNRIEHKVAQLREAIADQHRLGMDTQTSWMVGDTEADVCAGHTLQLPTVAVTCGIRSTAYLRGFQPTRMYRDLYAAAEFLLDHRPASCGL